METYLPASTEIETKTREKFAQISSPSCLGTIPSACIGFHPAFIRQHDSQADYRQIELRLSNFLVSLFLKKESK